MKITSRGVIFVAFLTFIWCVLNEKFNIAVVFTGILVSFITIYLLKVIQPDVSKNYSYNISIIRLLQFVLVMFKDIYLSAFRLSAIF